MDLLLDFFYILFSFFGSASLLIRCFLLFFIR